MISNTGLQEKANLLLFGIRKDEGMNSQVTDSESSDSQKMRRGRKAADFNEIGRKVEQWISIREHLQSDFTLDNISEDCDIPRSHLLQYFTLHVKRNFRSWKTEKKIRAVMEILDRDRDISVSDAADAVGFNDKSNFHRQFKRLTGMSPLQWRDRF